MRPRLPVLIAAIALAVDLFFSVRLAHADALDDAVSQRCAIESRLAATATLLLAEHDPIDRAALRDDAESHGVPAPSVRAWVGRGSPDALRQALVAFLDGQNNPAAWSRCAIARHDDVVALVMVPRVASVEGSLTPATLDERRAFSVHLPQGATEPSCMMQSPDGGVSRCDLANIAFASRGTYAFQILANTSQGPLPFATWHIVAGPVETDEASDELPQPQNALQLLAAINRTRAHTGREALRSDPMLTDIARRRATLLAARGAVAHTLVRDDSPVTRLRVAGVSADRVAENVARAHSVGEASARLDASPSHRANRIDPRLDAVGIGVATVGDDVYVVELYAARPRIGAADMTRMSADVDDR